MVEVHPKWLQLINELRERGDGQKRYTYEWLGQKAADAINRAEAFGTSTIERALKGQMTDEVLRALCSYFELPYPILSASEPAEVTWFDIGRRFAALDRSRFDELLRGWSEWVEIEERKRALDAKLKPPKDPKK